VPVFVADMIPTSNNMFTLRVLEGTLKGQVRPHHFTGCDHRQDGKSSRSVQRRREHRDVMLKTNIISEFVFRVKKYILGYLKLLSS